MLITSKMIWDELQRQSKLLMKLIEKEEQFSIEEVSLNKASKLLKLGPNTVLDEVQKGNLKARVYHDTKRRKRYRFRLADIREFQEAEKFDHFNPQDLDIESAEDIAKRIFG